MIYEAYAVQIISYALHAKSMTRKHDNLIKGFEMHIQINEDESCKIRGYN